MEENILKTIKKYELIESGDKVLIAVSGGPDSMCLLDVLNKLKAKLGIEIAVAHVNHGIRKEAKEETQYIKEYCSKYNIKIYVKYADVLSLAKEDKIGLEEEGRKVRYNFFNEVLEETGFNKIAIAHNMNDKAETVLMNIIRGAGSLGLKGIEAKRDNKYIRPLIETERCNIEKYCEENKLNPKLDQSNNDNTYTRNKIRNVLIPFIKEEFNPNIIKGINKLSEIVSNRHFGIGSDGLIVINPSDVADFKMSMYNADGSEGKMCGNGIRCVAKYVYDNKMTDKTTITVETLSGIKTLVLNVEDDKVKTVRVNMGSPILESAKVPVVSEKDKVIDEPVMVNNKEYRITCVSMGNPHAITFVDDIDSLDIEHIGPMFEKKEIFPEQVNTEFIQVVSRDVIKMRVWERGSGETLACGTGACASVVACVLNGLTEDNVTVKLLGGDLFIEYNRDENTVYMTGPARITFTGEFNY